MNYFFQQLKKHIDQKLPLVAYKKPKISKVEALLQADTKVHAIADYKESGFVFAPFDNRKEAYFIPSHAAKILSVEFDDTYLSNQDFNPQVAVCDDSSEKNLFNRKAHIEKVEDAINAIKNGVFSKVVLSRKEIVAKNNIQALDIFTRLLQRYPNAFVYIWYHPEIGLWLGATPETLLNVNNNELKTMALAGTQAFEGTTDVVWKEKEKEEQQIVTDFVVESLKISSGSYSTLDKEQLENVIKVVGPKTVQAGNLLHLRTDISMQLKTRTIDLKPVLNALHPTPAVCGYPKIAAKNYIIANEGYSREFYSGFLGELNFVETISRNTNRRNVENNAYRIQKRVSNLYVNLRCMQIKNSNIFIYVGGGITKDSDAEAEWEETVHKSKIIKTVL